MERPEIEAEAIIIWLPEFSQRAVNALVREIHRTLSSHGRPVVLDQEAPGGPSPVRAAYSAYVALAARRDVAVERVGTSSPRDLGEALRLLPSPVYRRRFELIGGARVLPLGRFFVEGRDIYATLLGDGTNGLAEKPRNRSERPQAVS